MIGKITLEKIGASVGKLETTVEKLGTNMNKLETTVEKMGANMGKLETTVEKLAYLTQESFINMDKKIDKRFEAVDARFDLVNKRFDTVEERFEITERRLLDHMSDYYVTFPEHENLVKRMISLERKKV
ncbi:MAG TPA: hypothetical protein VJH25_00265 [Candidatus Paceibacterota bacterium]